MMANDYVLAVEARDRIARRQALAARDALAARLRPTRPPVRVRVGEILVRLATRLVAASRPEPPVAAASVPGRPR